MQEVSTTNEQKQCSNPETSNAIVRGNTLHIVCQFLLLYGYLHLIVQTVGRASRAECSSSVENSSFQAARQTESYPFFFFARKTESYLELK